jgi:hypothetical protein
MSTSEKWTASQYMDDDRWGVLSQQNEIIVRTTSELTKEDARLIAAAPEMLEAIKEYVQSLESDSMFVNDVLPRLRESKNNSFDNFKRLIRKAEEGA